MGFRDNLQQITIRNKKMRCGNFDASLLMRVVYNFELIFWCELR